MNSGLCTRGSITLLLLLLLLLLTSTVERDFSFLIPDNMWPLEEEEEEEEEEEGDDYGH